MSEVPSFQPHLALGPGIRQDMLDVLRATWALSKRIPPSAREWFTSYKPRVPIAGSGVVLGTWTGPAGFPWDVAVVRVRWTWKGAPQLPDFPALVLEPRPLPAIADVASLVKQFEAYVGGKSRLERRGTRWTPSDAGTPSWWPLPETRTWPHPAAHWSRTLTLLDALDPIRDQTDTFAEVPERSAVVTRIWRDTPWLFLVHPALQESIRNTLDLPPALEGSPCVSAAVAVEGGAKGRKGAWPPGKVAARRVGAGHPEPVHVAYNLLLDRFPGRSREIVSFLEGGTDPSLVTTSSEDIPKRWSDRVGLLAESLTEPMMVPFFEESLAPQDSGRSGRDEVLLVWIAQRGPQALWLAFGRQADRLAFFAEEGAEGEIRGLESFRRARMRAHTVALAEDFTGDRDAWGWRWVMPVPDPGDAGQDERRDGEVLRKMVERDDPLLHLMIRTGRQ